MLSTLEKPEVETYPLGLRRLIPFHDRCDSCGAEALILAVKEPLELTFCGHHGRRYGMDLIAQGFIISDETDRLIPKPPVIEEEEE